MNSAIKLLVRPTVQVVGDIDHADFSDALALIRTQAQIVEAEGASPELIVAAQSRPGMIAQDRIELLRRRAPLAGMISLLGSWCEGETRTGRPWPGVERQYWYEFPSWWRRQLAMRAAGRCPDWARPFHWGSQRDFGELGQNKRNKNRGLIVLRIATCEMAQSIEDVVRGAGYATAWFRPQHASGVIHGAAAGIWAGSQLHEQEANDLAKFCRQLSRDTAPVIALLDFPRRDCVERALAIGASAVLPKPWRNVDLLAELEAATARWDLRRAA